MCARHAAELEKSGQSFIFKNIYGLRVVLFPFTGGLVSELLKNLSESHNQKVLFKWTLWSWSLNLLGIKDTFSEDIAESNPGEQGAV